MITVLDALVSGLLASALLAQAEEEQPAAGATPPAATAPAESTAAAEVRIQTVDSVLEGARAEISFRRGDRTLAVGAATVPLGAVVVVHFRGPDVSPGPLRVHLRGGDDLSATPLEGEESRVLFRSPVLTRTDDGDGALSVEVDSVQALALPAHFRDLSRYLLFRASLPGSPGAPITLSRNAPGEPDDRGEAAVAADKDVVITREGSRIEGFLERVDSRGIEFESENLGRVHLSYAKIRGVRIVALDADAAAADAGDPADPRVAVTFRDGSYLAATLLELGQGAVLLASPVIGTVRARLEDVRFLEPLGGRSVFLSDLQPAEAGTSSPLFSPLPVRRDASVVGGPLSIRGQVFRKGLGMHANTTLRYDLGGEYVRFQAVVGMDDSARPTSIQAEAYGGGSAVFRVLVDGNQVFERPLTYRDEPYSVDLPVAGARSLTLEVGEGRGSIVLDRADWADARLIRK